MNVLVAWVAAGYVNSTSMQMMLLLPFAECHDPWFPYSSSLPHTPCICPAWNGPRTSPFQGKSIERRPPRFLIYFFPREDNCTMTWRCLVMHHCPRSICPLQVHHLTLNICSRKLLFSRSEAFSREHLLIRKIVVQSRSSNSTRTGV